MENVPSCIPLFEAVLRGRSPFLTMVCSAFQDVTADRKKRWERWGCFSATKSKIAFQLPNLRLLFSNTGLL